MDQYLGLATLDYLRSSSGDQPPTGELRKLRFSVTNPGSRPEVFTLLARCGKEGTATVYPPTLRLGSGERSEVELLFRCSGWSRLNLWLTVQCLRGAGHLADESSICVNVGDDGHVRVVDCRGGDGSTSLVRPLSTSWRLGEPPVNPSEGCGSEILGVQRSTISSYIESLGPSSARVDSVVVKVYPYDPYCIHLKFKAVRDGSQEDFCLAGVKYIASEDYKDGRERALTRFSELVHPLQAEGGGPPAPEVRLGVVPGSGTPLLAHLGVSRGGGEERDVASVLLEEGLVVPDDGLTYSRGGYSAMAHGNVFHWHLVMLILLRMRSQDRSFRLAVEYQPAGKLDDVYLSVEGEDGAWEHMYMQLKHNSSGSGKIRFADLVKGKQKGPPKLCLKGFAQSYKNISNKLGRTNCILFTNQGLGFEEESESSLKKEDFHSANIKYPRIFHAKPLGFNGKTISELSKLLTDKNLTVEDAQMFLRHFYFAVNQWNAKELKEIVQAEMLEECQGRSDVMENKYSRVLEWIQSWMEREEGDYIDNKKLEEFFQRINLEIQGSINIVPRNVVMNFHKREKEEKIASKLLNLPKGAHNLDIVICGQPGVGKTEFALKVLEKNNKKFDHIIWVNAESKSSLQNAFFDLGKRLNIVTNKNVCSIEGNLKLTVEKIYSMFSQYKTLFIFDGVRDNIDIMEFLPSPYMNCDSVYMIATSNCTTLPCNRLIRLECFTVWDSVYFLVKELGLNDEDGAGELANLLGNHPMALQLASSLIKGTRNLPGKQDFSISDFIKDYKTHLMGDKKEDSKLTTLWNISIESVKLQKHGKLAIKILELMAYMEPEQIPLSIFEKYNESGTEYSYEKSLLLLKEYSLINYYEEKGSIHKLLQLVTRHNCKKEIIEKTVLIKLLDIFESLFIETNPELISNHITIHAMRIWFYAYTYEDLITQFDGIPVAIAYSNLSPETIISFIDQYINVLENVLSRQSMSFLHLLTRYITLLWNCEIYSRIIEICETYSTILPKLYKTSNNNLTRMHAISLQKLGKLDESLPLFQNQYCHEVCTFGLDSTQSIETLKNILLISYELIRKGNFDAFKIFLHLYEERISDSVASVEVSLDLLSSISSVVSLEGLPDSLQLPLLGSIHRALTVSYEETHVAALFVLLAKARQLCRMERGDEGRLLYVRVCQLANLDPGPQFNDLQGFLESFFSLHDSTLDVSQGLLKVILTYLTDPKVDLTYLKLQLRDKIATKAEELTQQGKGLKNDPPTVRVLESCPQLPTKVSDQLSASPAPSRSNLGATATPPPVARIGDVTFSKEESEARHQAVVGMLEWHNPRRIPTILRSSIKSIKHLKRHKKHSQVLSRCDKVLSEVSPHLMDNEDVLSVLQSKAESLHTTRHDQEAAQIWDELFARRTNSLGPDHLDTVHTLLGMCRTALALESAGNDKCFQSWSDLIRNRLNDGSVDCRKTFDVFQNVVSCLKDSGKEEFAITLCRTFNNTLVGAKGENYPLTLCNLLLQAECLWDVHKEREAWDIYTRVCNVRKIVVTNTPIKSAIFVLRMDLWNHVEHV